MYVVAMDTLLPCQQKQVLITLLFEDIRTSFLVHTFLKATAISGIPCCYGYLVILATEAGGYNIAVEDIQTSYLLQMFLEVLVIYGISCGYGHNVTMATEACTCNNTV